MIWGFVVQFTKNVDRDNFKDLYVNSAIHICTHDIHTHGAVAVVFTVGGSDCRFHIGFLQDAVGKPHMKGEQTTPVGERSTSSRHNYSNSVGFLLIFQCDVNAL